MSLTAVLDLVVAVICCQVSSGAADYEVEVTFHSYENPTGRCIGCRENGNPGLGCCDESFIRSSTLMCSQDDTCDTTIDYCIRDLQSMADGCVNQTVFSQFAIQDTNSYFFSPVFFGVDNPLLIEARNKSWNGIQLFLEVMDAIIVFNGFSDTVLIDSVSIDIDFPVGTSSPESIIYTGSAGLVQVGASFEVRCAENFTGWDCLTACSDFRNCSECGLPGFTGEFCQFSVENCKGVWCNGNNSQCIRARNGSYVCACETGFTGESCETLIDYCAGVTCSESGFCENTFPGYMCVCEQDYTGPMCEVEINECESVTCTGNGRCMEGQDSFVCECDPGFAGVLCERKVSDGSTETESTSTDQIASTTTGLEAVDPDMGNRTSTAKSTYYIIGGGVGGFVLLLVLLPLLVIALRLIIVKSKSAEILSTTNEEKYSAEPVKMSKLEENDQNLYGIT